MCQPRTQGSLLPVPTERERTWERGCTCIWLNPRAGKVKRILCSDWLSERARSTHLAGPSCVGPARKISLFGYFINPLLTKFVSSRWLSVGLFFFAFLVEWFYWENFGVLNRWSFMEVNSTLFDVIWCTHHLCPTTVSYGTVYSPHPLPSPPEGRGWLHSYHEIFLYYSTVLPSFRNRKCNRYSLMKICLPLLTLTTMSSQLI